MAKLFIFIPTYNRLDRLRLCISRVLSELTGHESDVHVHVSDNCSTDGSWEYLESLSHRSLSISRNPKNLGAMTNILKIHQHAHRAEYSWLLGDDDFLVKDAIGRILSMLSENAGIDIAFINSVAFDEQKKDETVQRLADDDYAYSTGGNTKSKGGRSTACTFSDLIDPGVDEVFGGSMMCYVFRSDRVKDFVTPYVADPLALPNIYNTYPHTLNWIYSLAPDSPAYYFHEPCTFNFWHHGAEWGKDAYHRVVTQGLGYLLFELIRLKYVPSDRIKAYTRHYLHIATPSLGYLLKDRFQDESTETRLNPVFLEKLITLLLAGDGLNPRVIPGELDAVRASIVQPDFSPQCDSGPHRAQPAPGDEDPLPAATPPPPAARVSWFRRVFALIGRGTGRSGPSGTSQAEP